MMVIKGADNPEKGPKMKLGTALEAVKALGDFVPGCIIGQRCPGDYGYLDYCNRSFGKVCRECWSQPVIFNETDLADFIREEQGED